MALIDNEKLYENIEKKLELIKAAKEQPVIMKPFIKDFAYRFCWSSNALEGNTLSLDETICLIDSHVSPSQTRHKLQILPIADY